MEKNKKTRVVLVDDDPFYRQNLCWLIQSSEGYDCIGTFGEAKTALAEIPLLKPDIVLMDIGLPETDGIACVRMLKHHMPELPIIMQTVYADDDKIFDSLRAGAVGYMLKKSPMPKILEAIDDALAGGAPMSGEVARKVLLYFRQPAGKAEDFGLSAREADVLNLLIDGLSYKEIAEKLFVSPHTVRFHLHNVYEKLHVRSRSEAVAKVRANRN